MPQTNIIIKWDFAPGSYGTRIEYKKSAGANPWVTPSFPANPTLDNEYPLLIDVGEYYDIRLSTMSRNGYPCKSITKRIIAQGDGSNVCCPPGYTLAPDESYCFAYAEVGATPPVSSQNLIKKSDLVYSTFGTLIYDPGYLVNGTGSSTQIDLSNTYWVNGTGLGTGNDTVKGPLNRTAIWVTSQLSSQTIGYSVCITTPVTKTYYIGVGADNSVVIKVDSVEIINMDPTAMSIYLSANGYPGTGVDATFKFWHIYPVTLSAGTHIVELIGFNESSVAAFGAQIYDASPAQLELVTNNSQLSPYLIFSSENEVGNPAQLGSDGIGYSCPSGYSLVLCDGSPKCRQLITAATINCINPE